MCPRARRDMRLGTRQSPLALWQARWVADRVRSTFPEQSVTLIPMTTSGDRVRGVLGPHGGKALFVKELDEALRAGAIDCAVHSLKDVPGVLDRGIAIAACSPRGAAHDLCVTPNGTALADLPDGARVGTSSPRRHWQLRALHPALALVPMRGNVQTRLRKMQDGAFDAIILAAAGVKRLGLTVHGEILPTDRIIPAVGQGTLAITVRADDTETMACVRAACHDAQNDIVTCAERALLAAIGGDCDTPLAGYAVLAGDVLTLRAFLATPDGARQVRHAMRGDAAHAEALGKQMATWLLEAIRGQTPDDTGVPGCD